DHLVGGIEWLPDENSRLNIEGFYKFYRNYPFSVRDSVSISSKGADFGTFGDEEVLSIAKGRAYGMEILYRNRDLLGTNVTVAYTLVRSETEAFRQEILKKEEWVPTAWDNKHLLNLLALREFKNNWSLGLKFRFVGGVPFTPFDKLESSYVQAWNARRIGILDYDRFNMERLDAFHQLDIRIDKEIFLRNISLNFYIDVQNVYNFKAEQQTVLTLDEDADPLIINPEAPIEQQRYALEAIAITGGTVLPTFGIIVQF
ncbi:MAG: TonB-dependent receptor, partial [Bacteroidota bacterium]